MLRLAVFLLSSCFFGGCTAQSPENKLEEKYPEAKKINWRTDRNGNEEAHFTLNGSSYRADFSPDGHWIETERNIKWSELPPAVKESLDKNAHVEKKHVVEIEEVNHHEKGWFYDVEIRKKKGKRDIQIAPDGRVIQKEAWK